MIFVIFEVTKISKNFHACRIPRTEELFLYTIPCLLTSTFSHFLPHISKGSLNLYLFLFSYCFKSCKFFKVTFLQDF